MHKTVAEFADAGLVVEPHLCDLSSDQAVSDLGARISAAHGAIDVVFNNAYIPMLGTVEKINIEDWRRAFDVNVLGYVRIVKAFVDPMIARKSGHFVFTASPMGIVPPVAVGGNMMPYIVSKAADIGLAQAMAIGLRQHGIGVSLFFPAITNTWSETPPGDVSSEFLVGMEQFIRTGMTPEQAAELLLSGLEGGDFCIAASDQMRPALEQAGRNGFDPFAFVPFVPGASDDR